MSSSSPCRILGTACFFIVQIRAVWILLPLWKWCGSVCQVIQGCSTSQPSRRRLRRWLRSRGTYDIRSCSFTLGYSVLCVFEFQLELAFIGCDKLYAAKVQCFLKRQREMQKNRKLTIRKVLQNCKIAKLQNCKMTFRLIEQNYIYI